MANEVRMKFDSKQNFTISLASLADQNGRQSTMVNNTTHRPGAIVYLRIKSGTSAPSNATVYAVYLLRGDDTSPTYRTDNAGASDAAITIENAQLLGHIVVTDDASKNFYGEFDTAALGPLGPQWGIAVVNESGAALSSTEGDHYKAYAYYVPEVQ